MARLTIDPSVNSAASDHGVAAKGSLPAGAGSVDGDTAASGSDLRRRTARGAMTSVAGQAANFALRIASMMILARLVTPEHFGLVGMVTVITGVITLFRDAGLPQATIQQATLSVEQISTLFWINLGIGAALAIITVMIAPFIASFYGDPRLLWITVALAGAFLFNGAAAQHKALLQRSMRFGTLMGLELVALVASLAAGIATALLGWGYWSLVVMAVSLPAVLLVGAWNATRWVPGPPRRAGGVLSMLHYGGTITLNSVIVYIAYNADKVMVGRFWGAEALGVYGRAYQLVSIPTENLSTTISWVMFPALARVQSDPQRTRAYFLKSYAMFLALAMPITMACSLFASDVVRVLLGPQWTESVPIFQLLAPTILAFALINPMGTLMQATGHAGRSMRVAFLIAPVVILGCAIGLPYGANGVALGYSISMIALVIPVILWARKGHSITGLDIARTIAPPLVTTVLGALAAMAAAPLLLDVPAIVRLTLLTSVLLAAHALALLVGFGQWRLIREFIGALALPSRRGS